MTLVLVAAIGVIAKDATAPTALVAPMAEVVSVTVPVPMYSLAGVAGANTVVPLKLVPPTVTSLTKAEVPELLKPVVVRVVPSKVRFAELAWMPPVLEYTTRPEVSEVLVIEELETPVRPVRAVTH